MRLRIDKNIKVWITSDTHYGHTNICRGTTNWRTKDGQIPIVQTRDFSSLELMNEAIVNNINSVVGENDVLINVGDWSFGGFENIEIFRNLIICKNIYNVNGNHDHHLVKNKENCQMLFKGVYDILTLEYGKDVIEILHYPMLSWNSLNKGRIHLHGHCHLPNDKKIFGRRMDIGIDGHLEFRPYDLKTEVIDVLKTEPIKSQLWELDHHLDELNEIE